MPTAALRSSAGHCRSQNERSVGRMRKHKLAAMILLAALPAVWAIAQNRGAAPQGGAQDQVGRGRGGRRGNRAGRKTLLIWADTRNGVGQHESTGHAMATIERLGYESGLYDSYIRTDSEIISRHPLM